MRGLPEIDARYWLLLLTASVCGTNLGDFASDTLGLGFLGAFPTFMLLFLVMVFAAGRVAFVDEAYYCLAIVISRAGATDIADLATHEMRPSSPWLLGFAVIGLGLTLAVGARFGQNTIVVSADPGGGATARPSGNATYWVAMILASAFGTVAGDYLASELGIGLGGAALVSTAIAGVAVVGLGARVNASKLSYWGVVLAIRTVATNLGDLAAGDDGLGLGFALSCTAAFAHLIVFTLTWRPRRLATAS